MVWFVGISSGRLDLINVKTLILVKVCDVCLYAGSMLIKFVTKYCNNAKLVKNTIKDKLEDIILFICLYKSYNVVRVHSGDLGFFSNVDEQIYYCKLLSVELSVVSNVGMISIASSWLQQECVHVNCMLIAKLNRRSVLKQRLFNMESLCVLKPVIALFLSVRLIGSLCNALICKLGSNCSVICWYKFAWNCEVCFLSDLVSLENDVTTMRISRLLFIVIKRDLFFNRITSVRLY